MASGHVYRANQAEHMAAPTNAASEDSSCQPGAVHTWPGSAEILLCNKSAAVWGTPAVAQTHPGRQPVTLGGHRAVARRPVLRPPLALAVC